jgi:N-acyl-D-amino-acid deacylase
MSNLHPTLRAISWPLGLIALLTLAGPARAERPPVTGREVPDLASYDRLVPQFMEKWDLPGGAVAVVKDGRLVFARGYGYADVDRGAAVQPDALFRLASVSKPITAVTILRLVELGKLDLDSKICDVLKQQPRPPKGDQRWRDITIRQLLHHTGGWDRDKSFDPMFRPLQAAEAVGAKAPASSEAIVRYMLGGPLDFTPGERFAYSNFGYCLLGRAIEAKTGQSYADAVRDLVLRPCGIERMRIGHTRLGQRAPDEVHYYNQPADATAKSVFPEVTERVPPPYGGFYLEAMDSHGAWIGSAFDLMRFVSAVDGSHHRPILKPASQTLMTSRPAPPVAEGKPTFYGLGWNVRPVGDDANWWHSGSLPGTSTLLVRTSRGLAWAALFNSRPESKPGSGRGNFSNELDSLLWKAAEEVKNWPRHNLFEAN